MHEAEYHKKNRGENNKIKAIQATLTHCGNPQGETTKHFVQAALQREHIRKQALFSCIPLQFVDTPPTEFEERILSNIGNCFVDFFDEFTRSGNGIRRK